ncbi:hypothetical protein [Myxococcus sp. SDU36]|uniref:hypothetical protein n=1 Tax=Myxococcus sp. SDU36 TaxID=2831967 RepID=UPI002543DEB6|nr:hypothetical protein [Myxococcus sp. SDU36]WIG99526.1 hypothetical protein KGD87_25690 [Myxococcus sp. SDU36]
MEFQIVKGSRSGRKRLTADEGRSLQHDAQLKGPLRGCRAGWRCARGARAEHLLVLATTAALLAVGGVRRLRARRQAQPPR